MTREEALALLHEWTLKDGLRKHAYGVEAAMRAYARRFGEDEAVWGVVGLLHDFDYERYPDAGEPPVPGRRGAAPARPGRDAGAGDPGPRQLHRRAAGHPRGQDPVRGGRAGGHGHRRRAGPARASSWPRSTVPSVIKKMKDKAFARAVNREEIREGAESLGVSLEEHIGVVLAAMQGISSDLGL